MNPNYIVSIKKAEREARQKLVAQLVAQNELVAPTQPQLVAPHKDNLSHLGQGKKLPKDVIDNIVSYKLSYPNESNRAIAKKFGVSEITIRRLLKVPK